MAKVTFVFTDDGDNVDIVAECEPAMPSRDSERTNAQHFAHRIAQFITQYGKANSELMTVEAEDDKGNVNFKAFSNGIEVKKDGKTN